MSSSAPLLVALLVASASPSLAFAPSSALPLRATRARSAACAPVMQTNPKGDGDREYPSFDPDMSVLNDRINKLKERETNPLNRIQDTVTDKAEDFQRESKKLANNVPVPDVRTLIPVTGLPKWVLPLSAIVGLSVLTSVLQTQATLNTVDLASGSL
uniref:Plastid lipid-associated protein/fibrillin conserved domain-containing protein n=1 Tax=Hemiselmis tepida TaxID=464990 RepID=A0A7S0V8F8_9CRYP|mmetsp:Transcript_14478/g.37002  ORF Transcript_14478/g.37002 Transcript_14478/m.37002 type:complete len:157 (+) Transcript_14478:40-510(+)|eukprot:CAMPEP_0174921120 /NCGR_PEP_ID=MMETSP1355-20121228/4930_1 /TAXON_ID=464990 /ORGANISM="Hemiselmis tepida, Strain CCMP443" /LENGTH=156 /DNA_ID=CAMNT_0016166565 /DNA_START=25 /DNA_END=495 /DNA_ORIENTATION=-